MNLEDEGQSILVTVNIQDTVLTSRITKDRSPGLHRSRVNVILVFKSIRSAGPDAAERH